MSAENIDETRQGDEGVIQAHSLSSEQVLELLGSSLSKGLSGQQAEANLLLHGYNKIPVTKSSTVWEKLWAQINSVLIYILVAGAIISFFFHHIIDGVVIIGVVVINVSLGYFMEAKAENATESLKGMMSPSAQVLRDENKQSIEATHLTVGDIFFLQPGDIAPADGRVLVAVDLSVLESPLTGESHPIIKNTEPTSRADVPLAERKCMVYSGTQVLKGTATCVVTAIGKHCEIGKISGLLTEIEVEKTPLLVQLERFGMILSVVIICLAIAAFGIAYGTGYNAGDALALSIGIAVAAIPEGLPSCITITFAIGVRYMARRHAIVKSLPAVETLGSVNVICSDKTGTLTINKMTVKQMHTSSSTISFADDGTPDITSESGGMSSSASSPQDDILLRLLPGILCNDGSILTEEVLSRFNPTASDHSRPPQPAPLAHVDYQPVKTDAEVHLEMTSEGQGAPGPSAGDFLIQGDPTETCILTLAVNLSASAEKVKALSKNVPRVAEIPFDSATKYMATMNLIEKDICVKLHAGCNGMASHSQSEPEVNAEGKCKIVFVKGAPEKIIALCETPRMEQLDHLGRIIHVESVFEKYWMDHATTSATNGMRVLGLAYTIVPLDFVFDGHLKPCSGFTMTALVGIMDPPRPEAIVAIKQAQEAGICVKMITGDHPVTALAIGRMLGLHVNEGRDVESGGSASAVTGNDLDQLIISSMSDFDETVMNNDIFARTTPEHKLRIVQSLQRQGCVCSMTGDGVNDAPALKAANIGVAMGITGTEVAKDAADVVLTDDNFATIVEAIRIGRCTYTNLVKIITFVLPSNGGQAFCILAALIIGVAVPITALQILWVNMITSVTLGLVLAFDKPSTDILTQMPRRKDKRLFGRFLTWRLVFVTAVLTVAVLGVFQWEKRRIDSLDLLRTIAVNTLSIAQIGYVFNCRNLRNNVGVRELLGGNKWLYVGIFAVLVFQMLFTYAPPLQYVFATANMDGESWGKIVLVAFLVFLLVEGEKFISALRSKRPRTRSRKASHVTITVGGF